MNVQAPAVMTNDSETTSIGAPSLWLYALILFLGLTALSVACHYLGFSSLVVYDGAYFIKSKEPLFAQHDILRIVSIVPVRPLFLFTFYLNYLFTGMDPFYLRALNATMVAAGGMALATLALLIFQIPGLGIPGSFRTRGAVAVLLGVLFTVHPLQSLVVLYEWQREAIMGFLFYYSALAAYVAVRSHRVSPPAGYVLSAALFLAGLLSKENVATLPIVLLLAEATLFRQSIGDLFSRGITVCYIYGPPLLLYLLTTHLLHTDHSELVKGIIPRLLDHYSQAHVSLLEVMLTQCRIFFSYVWMMLFPFAGNVELMRAEIISRSLLQPPHTLAAVAGVFAILGIAIVEIRRRPLLSFGFLFAIVSLLPESLLIPQYLFFGYRAILPMAGPMLIVGYLLLSVTQWTRARLSTSAFRMAATAAALIPIVALASTTAARARHWTHVTFWTDLSSRLPEYSRDVEPVPFLDISVNCMSTLVYDKKYDEAIALFQRVLAAPGVNGNPGASHDIGTMIEGFLQIFGDQKMRAGGAMIALGAALQLTDRIDEAMRAYAKAVEIEPHHVDVHITLGNFSENSGKLSDAKEHYEKAIELDPANALAHNCLGNVLKRMGNVREAMEEYARAIYVAPESVMGYTNLGSLLQELGYYREAIAEYRKGLAADPNSAETHHRLGRAFAESGNAEEALQNYRKALELDPDNALARCDLGLLLESTGNAKEAVAEYEKASESPSAAPMAYVLLGRSLATLERYPEAVVALSSAVELAPDLPTGHHYLGVVLLKTGHFAQAAKKFEKALELYPHFSEACTHLGLALMKQGNISGALTVLKRSVALDHTQPLPHVYLANALELTGDFHLAEHEYEIATRLAPGSAELRYRLASCQLHLGNASAAAENYRACLRLKPDYPQAHANLAVALLQAGRIPEAITSLAQALALNPESTEALFGLGLAYAQMKKDDEAVAYFDHVLRKNPKHEPAKRHVERIRGHAPSQDAP
ncbi:MAG: tetratricopeptide repeat protein [Thermodesulfobacteriota bacterium]